MMDKLKALCQKHREVLTYLIAGGLTTVINWAAYVLFVRFLHTGVQLGKVLSWICAVSFAYAINKLWVFQSKSWVWPAWLREAAAFFSGRLGSGLVEIGCFALLIRLGMDFPLFGVDGLPANIASSVLGIILNYFISKFWVFRKKKEA